MVEIVAILIHLLALGEPAECNRIAFAMSAIASEAANQPIVAQINVARAVRDNASCGDPNYLSGYRIALNDPAANNHHARAYFQIDSFDQEKRWKWFVAAYIAYTESDRVPIRHFTRFDSTATWWDSPKACPNGWWVIEETRFC